MAEHLEVATGRASGAEEPESSVAGAAPAPAAQGAALSGRRTWGWQLPAIVFLVGLIVTAALAVTSLAVYDRNETRLLGLRVHQLGLVLAAQLPAIQTPLASAAELADVTRGDATRFRSFMAPYVGPGRQFASASLWRVGAARLAPTVVVGAPPALASVPRQARRFFAQAERSRLLSITGILGSSSPRLGYEFNTPGIKNGFAVYAENPLPKDRRSLLSSNSAFADLDYAIYLGHSRRPHDLLVTSLQRFPITGRQASGVVGFGDGVFTVVITPHGSLGGMFFEALPWITAVLGVLLALAAALMTDRLGRRRRYAEQLAGVLDGVAAENRQLYTEQRSIAQTLQHALLPESVPVVEGLETTARYVPAGSDIEVGGDWYDLVVVDDQHALLVIGDVTGHGLQAASTMASLRFAALAYAAADHRPGAVLDRLSDYVGSQAHDYFATVLCVLIDVGAHQLTVASAGHIAPLVIGPDDGQFVEISVGVPIGVDHESPYHEVTISVAAGSTVLAFTDGLVERRAESLDVGLARLRRVATARPLPLEDLVEMLANDLVSEGHHDDTAIMGVRWRS